MTKLTDDDFYHVFKLARGVFECPVGKMQRIDSARMIFTQGYSQYMLHVFYCTESDVRIEGGYSVVLERTLIKDKIVVDQEGMKSEQSLFNEKVIEVVMNINLIVEYLNDRLTSRKA